MIDLREYGASVSGVKRKLEETGITPTEKCELVATQRLLFPVPSCKPDGPLSAKACDKLFPLKAFELVGATRRGD